MNFSDIEALIKTEQKCQKNLFVETDNISAYLLKIKSSAEFITHYSSGQCAGFVAFYCNDPTKELAFITLVLLSPEFRGRGLASSLINYTLKHCKKNGFKKCELEVKKDNYSAIKLYKKIGFIIENNNNEKLLMSFNL